MKELTGEEMEKGRDNMSRLGERPAGADEADEELEKKRKWENEGYTNEEMERMRVEKLESEVAVLEKKVDETVTKFRQLEQYINKYVRTNERKESNK